jgi:magnesium chelatase family protein
MSLAIVISQAMAGFKAQQVRVEVHIAPGLPAFSIVGLASAGVKESRERVRSAILSSRFRFPDGRVTVNLAPADLPKESGRYDLSIALGVLLASGQINEPGQAASHDLARCIVLGELSLTGAIKPVADALGCALAVSRDSADAMLILAPASARVAARVPGVQVVQAESLDQVVQHFSGQCPLPCASPDILCTPASSVPCLADVKGQLQARHVLEIAACGGHSMLMSGSPGVGKSMLAQRLPGLLPRLSLAQSLEVAALAEYGRQGTVCLSDVAPYRAPHHSASTPAIVGGGARPRPGEISLAHHGVLFLDELPHFQAKVLESLREPLETGQVSVARSSASVTFPARFMLVTAMNPCPCGWSGSSRKQCACKPDEIQRYRRRLSGPLLDRIDLQIMLPDLEAGWISGPAGETSASVALRVQVCRDLQLQRQGRLNAELDAAGIQTHCCLDASAQAMLLALIERWVWSARVVHRILRVARTLADMQASPLITKEHLAEAAQYREPWR